VGHEVRRLDAAREGGEQEQQRETRDEGVVVDGLGEQVEDKNSNAVRRSSISELQPSAS
jgi:hypothetical protein